MKEATGDLNLAVIVVVIVSMLSLFFFSYIWPSIQNNFSRNTRCDEAICDNKPNDDGSVTCHLKEKPSEKFTCAWKG